MKKHVRIFIVVSLALNVAFTWFLVAGLNAPSPATADSPETSPSSLPSASEGRPLIDPDIWPSLHTDELPALVSRLRATGFPPEVIRAILSARLGDAFIARRK